MKKKKKNTRVSCHFLLQAIFPTQELNPGLWYRKQILYYLSLQRLSHSYYNCIWNAFNKVSLIMMM